jgi:hypothetical protein
MRFGHFARIITLFASKLVDTGAFCYCGMRAPYVLQEVAAICGALAKNTQLMEFNSSGRKMDPAAAALVATMLSKNASLLNICVGDSSFGDKVGSTNFLFKFSTCFIECCVGCVPSSAALQAEEMTFHAQGVEELSCGLRSNSTLQNLDLEFKVQRRASFWPYPAVIARVSRPCCARLHDGTAVGTSGRCRLVGKRWTSMVRPIEQLLFLLSAIISRSMGRAPSTSNSLFITETNRIQMVIFGPHNRVFGS